MLQCKWMNQILSVNDIGKVIQHGFVESRSPYNGYRDSHRHDDGRRNSGRFSTKVHNLEARETVRRLTPLRPTKKAYKGYRSVVVTKPVPYAFDLTHLLAYDPNPLPPTSTLLANRITSTNPTLHTIA